MSTPSPSSDPSKLVERLQTLKKRLANMAKTLESNVASASPVRGVQSDDIVYSTPRLVKELIDGKLGEDRSLFLEREEGDDKSGDFMEVRFTMIAGSDSEMEQLIMELRANPNIDPKALSLH